MEKYNIQFAKSAEKELLTIPKSDLKRILKRIKDLSDNPYPVGSIKLTNREEYRVRQGNYRIVYSVDKQSITIIVIKIAYRNCVYHH